MAVWYCQLGHYFQGTITDNTFGWIWLQQLIKLYCCSLVPSIGCFFLSHLINYFVQVPLIRKSISYFKVRTKFKGLVDCLSQGVWALWLWSAKITMTMQVLNISEFAWNNYPPNLIFNYLNILVFQNFPKD